jgi:hypothetical protein
MFAVLLLMSAAAGAHEVRCPETYPSNQMKLPTSSPGQTGSGVVRAGILSDAYIYIGELHAQVGGFDSMVGPAPKRVKGGEDIEYSFSPSESKWLVCAYGGNELSKAKPRRQGRIEWWEPIAPRSTSCVLQVREAKQPYQLPSTWSAVATCKSGE